MLLSQSVQPDLDLDFGAPLTSYLPLLSTTIYSTTNYYCYQVSDHQMFEEESMLSSGKKIGSELK